MGAWTMVGRWDFDVAPGALAALARARDGEVLHADRFTVVLRRGDLVVKHRAESLFLRLRRIGQGSALVREHDALSLLAGLGLETVRPRGAAAIFSGPIVREEILVTTFRAGLASLGYARRAKRPVERSVALAALIRLAHDLKRVHDAGFYVNTLADRNVLVGPGGEYAVLDCGRAGRRGRAARDLGLLDKGLSSGTLSRTDRLRLLRAYAGEGAEGVVEYRPLVAAVASERARFERRGPFRALSRRVNRWLRKRSFLRSQLR
jgi:hypothetical protein